MPIHTTVHSFVATLAVAGMAIGDCSQVATPTTEDFSITTLATGLTTPWDMEWGPDSMIWVSERGGHISRVDPASGRRTPAGNLVVRESGEGGLMGIAFHPDFAHESYVYAMHTYAGDGGATMNRLVRMRWDGTALG